MNTEKIISEVCAYHAVMATARRLVSQGVISQEDYANIDTIIAKKHSLSLDSIFR